VARARAPDTDDKEKASGGTLPPDAETDMAAPLRALKEQVLIWRRRGTRSGAPGIDDKGKASRDKSSTHLPDAEDMAAQLRALKEQMQRLEHAARTRAPEINDRWKASRGEISTLPTNAENDVAAQIRALKEQVQHLEQERHSVVSGAGYGAAVGDSSFGAIKREQTRVVIEDQQRAEDPPTYIASWGDTDPAGGASGHDPASKFAEKDPIGSATGYEYDPYAADADWRAPGANLSSGGYATTSRLA
jgi:uncharacterized protein (UPF0335 family)